MKKEELTALGLTEDQSSKVFELHGKEITKLQNTISTITTERDGLKTQLGEVNGKLAGYDPDWKSKADQAQQDADKKVSDLQYDFAAKDAISGYKFTSESAKKAFYSDLLAKKLPLQDGKLLGLDDFKKTYQESDPNAFSGDKPAPQFSAAAPGPSAGTLTGNDKANAALREAFGHTQS